MQKILLSSFAFQLILFLCFYTPVRATQVQIETSKMKIEIVKIKDSGSSPYWSPDGKEIVYVDKGGLFVITSSGSGKQRKIASGSVREPRWSPDGKYIAYVDRKGLKIISPDKSGKPKLIYPDNNVQMPEWSSDSKWITFYLSALKGNEGSGVFAVNINTFKSKQLSYTGINPFWNVNGKSVFYFTDDEKSQGFGQLFLVDLDSGSLKELAPIGAECMNFNLEKNLLAFSPKKKDGASHGIYLSHTYKNDTPIKLLDNGYFPSFSFDGKWLSFSKYDPRDKRTKIYIILLNYELPLPTDNELIEVGNGIFPRWAFNKKALVYETLGIKGGIYVAKISDGNIPNNKEKGHDN